MLLPRIEVLESRIAPAFGAVVDLGSLNGSNGFTVTGAMPGDFLGSSVDGIGDINGDGLDDLIIGADQASAGMQVPGATYVIFGRTGGFGTNVDVSTLDGTTGFRILGLADEDFAGFSAKAAGDMNGDGFDDLIMSSPDANTGGIISGHVYVIFGKASFSADVDLASLDGTNGFSVPGMTPYEELGTVVAGVGDLNGDGFDDVAIGAPYASTGDSYEHGNVYVIFGKGSPFGATVPLNSLDGSNGFRVNGTISRTEFGNAIAGGGDVNGDGFDDLVVAAHHMSTGVFWGGRTYVLFGKATGFAAALDDVAIAGANGFTLSGMRDGDQSGRSVALADINDDGFSDVFLGANGPSGSPGSVYVYFGHTGAFQADTSLSTLNGTNGFEIITSKTGGNFGLTVSSAGDANGDGIEDILIGSPSDRVGQTRYGAAHLIFGKSGAFGSTLDAAVLNGANGVLLKGSVPESEAGRALGAGDFNGDGFTDLLIAALPTNYGATYVVFGQPSGAALPELSIADVSVMEGPNGSTVAEFIVSLSTPSTTPVTVTYVTAGGTATAGQDYTAVGPTVLTFAPGEVTKSVTVSITGDFQVEGNETFALNLSDASNATISDGEGVATVLNDDAIIAVQQGGSKITLTDIDGDAVVITTTNGTLGAENLVFAPDGSLQAIDLLEDLRFTGANISVTARTMKGAGNGAVDLPFLNATSVDLGQVKISGNLGRIIVGDGDPNRPALRSLTVGSLGSDGNLAEPLVSEILGALGKLTVRGDVRGAAVDVQGKLGRATIGGNLSGDTNAGAIILQAILDGRDFDPRVGGGIPTGSFNCNSVGAFSVKGGMTGGALTSRADIGNFSVGQDLAGAAVAAAGQIRNVKVFGSMTGEEPDQPVVVAAVARLDSSKPTGAVAIDALQIRGDVENAQILLGYQKRDSNDNPGRYLARNPDASAGRVVVNGDWTATNLIAGVFDSTGDGFGRNDAPITGDTTPRIISRIASVVIKGTATGTIAEGDHYGITAQQIGSVTINGARIILDPTIKNDILIDGENQDFRVVEV